MPSQWPPPPPPPPPRNSTTVDSSRATIYTSSGNPQQQQQQGYLQQQPPPNSKNNNGVAYCYSTPSVPGAPVTNNTNTPFPPPPPHRPLVPNKLLVVPSLLNNGSYPNTIAPPPSTITNTPPYHPPPPPPPRMPTYTTTPSSTFTSEPPQQQQQQQRHPKEPPPRIDPSQIPRIPCFTRPKNEPAFLYNPDTTEKPPEAYERYVVAPNTRNASPRIMRCTTFVVPQNKSIADKCNIPLGLCIMPFATGTDDEQVPTITYSHDDEPIRCKSCQAYFNPFDSIPQHYSNINNDPNTTNNNTTMYTCIFCKSSTPISSSSFSSSTVASSYGIVDHIVHGKYNVRQTMRQPYYLYAIETTSWNRASHALRHFVIPQLQKEYKMILQTNTTTTTTYQPNSTHPPKIGFFLFDGHACYFPYFQSNQIQLAVMADFTEDPFCPIPLNMFTYSVVVMEQEEEETSILDQVLDAIPSLLQSTTTTLAAAEATEVSICAAMSVLRSALAETGGRGTTITSLLPNSTTTPVSSINSKNNPSSTSHPTDSATFYKKLGEDCHMESIRLDIVLLTTTTSLYNTKNSSTAISILGEVCNATCGKLRRLDICSSWQDDECPLALELSKLCTIWSTATDAVLKLRISNGIRLKSRHAYLGNGPGFLVSSGGLLLDMSPELEMAHVGAETCIVANLEHSVGGIPAKSNHKIYFQAALLYTTPFGQRRVRVMNLCLSSTTLPSIVFRNADYASIAVLMSRQVISDILDNSKDDSNGGAIQNNSNSAISIARENLIETTVQILTCYRLHTTAIKSPIGQLILPEALQLLPIWSLSMLKSKTLRLSSDSSPWYDRAYHMLAIQVACPALVTLLVHPNMYRVDTCKNGEGELVRPKPTALTTSWSTGGGNEDLIRANCYRPYVRLPESVQCSISCMEDEGVYIIDDCFVLYVYVGKNVCREVLLELFSVTYTAELTNTKSSMDSISTSTHLGKQTRNILLALRNWYYPERPSSSPIVIVSAEMDLQYLMVDDPFPQEKGYVDYLCLLHRRIKQFVEAKEQYK